MRAEGQDGASAALDRNVVTATIRPPGRGWAIRALSWIPGERAAVVSASQGDKEPALYVVDPRERTWKRLPIPRAACLRLLLLFPTAQTRHSVSFVAGCVGPKIRPPLYFAKLIKEYSFTSGRIRELRPYSLPFPAGAFSFDPRDPTRGLVNDGYGLSENLRWLLPNQLSKRLPLPLDRVGDPVWSPDGRLVMISGAGGLEGVPGVERTFATWSLYTLDPRSLRLRKIAGGLDQVFRGSWSQDGKVYAVNLPTESGTRLSLIRLRDRRIVTVAQGTEGEVVWTGPHTLLAVRRSPDRLELIDVRTALEKLSD